MMRLVEVEAKPQASMASSLQIGSQSTTPPTEKSVPTVPAEKSGGAASTGRANASVGDVPLYDPIGNELHRRLRFRLHLRRRQLKRSRRRSRQQRRPS